MIEGLLGKKIGMTHLFGAESRVVPVTVIEVGPCVVTQVKTQARDGYDAVQIGFGQAKQLTKPAEGHQKAAGARLRHLREFKAGEGDQFNAGDKLDVSQFKEGDLVDVIATVKGRGFQGVVKRYNYSGGPKTHGQGDRHRSVGSIGAGTFPGRVIKGKTMPGHMGNVRRTARNLRVAKVDTDRNLLLVHGSIGGPRNGLIMVRHAQGASAQTAAGE